MNIKNLFNPDVQEVLTEESLTAIQEAFDKKVEIKVNEALEQQDIVYAEQLRTLVKTISVDYGTKLTRILEAKDTDYAQKFSKVVKAYKRQINNESVAFKKSMLGGLSAYLDEFIKETVDIEDIKQAAENKSAMRVLNKLRQHLSIDTVMMKESVRGPILEGVEKQKALEKENKEIKDSFTALYEQNQKLQAQLILESKVSGLSDTKKKFLVKNLQDKSAEFITENFDYTARLFDKHELNQRKVLKEEALENRKVKPDVVPEQKVVEEKVNNDEAGDMYVTELSRVFGTR